MKLADNLVTTLGLDEYDYRLKTDKLYRLLLEKQRRVATKSLYYFSKYVLQFKDIEIEPHWELCNFLQKYDKQDVLILLPRGTFKSTICSVSYPLWKLIVDISLRFLISSGELSNSQGFLGLISDHITKNLNFIRLLGDLSGNKSDTWTKTSISLAGRRLLRAEDSITASSVKITKVSQHYDFAILDDLVNEKNVTTKDQMDQVWNYLQLILPLLDPIKKSPTGETKPGPRKVIGTRWSFDDAYGRILAEEKARRRRGERPEWKVLIREDRYPDGRLYFPTRLTETFLKKMQRSMSRNNYSCQYRNNPLPDEDRIFKLSKLGFFWVDSTGKGKRVLHGYIDDMPTIFNKFTAMDPSVGETNDSDFTAIVTNAVDFEANMYCWDVVRERIAGNDAILQRLMQTYQQHRPLRVGIESVVFSKSLYWGFQKLARQMNLWFPIEKLQPSTRISKDLRIQGFEPFVTGGRFFLRVAPQTDLTASSEELYYALLPGQDILADEMLRFPKGSTDDCLDAQAYMPQLIFPANVPANPKPTEMSFDSIRKRFFGRRMGRIPLR